MRTRDWRRSQRERIRNNRRQLFSHLWFDSAEYIVFAWRNWSKVNPGTACSCAMCSDPRKRPEPPTEMPFRIRPGLYDS